MNIWVIRHSLHLNSMYKFVSSFVEGQLWQKGHKYLNKPAVFCLSMCDLFSTHDNDGISNI